MTHPYVRESNHPDCEPSMRFRATLPDGTMRYRGTLAEALAELPDPDPGWRDVRHELPEEGEVVIVWFSPYWDSATYDAGVGWRAETGEQVYPSHWMPVLGPPPR